jgi:predicted alpha/beta hydrolase family esterase
MTDTTDRSHLLRPFRVFYRDTADLLLMFDCEAETADHAEEQWRDAEPAATLVCIAHPDSREARDWTAKAENEAADEA